MEGGITPGLENLAPGTPGSQEGLDLQGAQLSKQESQEEWSCSFEGYVPKLTHLALFWGQHRKGETGVGKLST